MLLVLVPIYCHYITYSVICEVCILLFAYFRRYLIVSDSNIQREICCTLGRASSSKRSSCSSRVYVRLVKQNLRLKLKSEQLGLQQQITEVDQYRCVLKHKSSYERCCLASKNSQNNKLTRQQQRTTNRRRHLQQRNS